MREKPIIFSTPMVKAILENRKHQTRRVMVPQPVTDTNGYLNIKGFWVNPKEDINAVFDRLSPYGKVGDILWVRETHRFMGFESNTRSKRALVKYRDESNQWVVIDDYRRYIKFTNYKDGWKPSIHMPREAARIFLKVAAVRVERLQDISEEDAEAEGIDKEGDAFCHAENVGNYGGSVGMSSVRYAFQHLWNLIGAKRGYSWESNPWVWVYEFEMVKNGE